MSCSNVPEKINEQSKGENLVLLYNGQYVLWWWSKKRIFHLKEGWKKGLQVEKVFREEDSVFKIFSSKKIYFENKIWIKNSDFVIVIPNRGTCMGKYVPGRKSWIWSIFFKKNIPTLEWSVKSVSRERDLDKIISSEKKILNRKSWFVFKLFFEIWIEKWYPIREFWHEKIFRI